MARKPRELSTEQKIYNINSAISELEISIEQSEETLANLRKQKKEYEEELQKEKINLLVETIQKKDITLDKAKEIIDNMEWVYHKKLLLIPNSRVSPSFKDGLFYFYYFT